MFKVILLNCLLGLLFCGQIAAQNFIEISVSGDTSLALEKANIIIHVQDQYALPEGILPEDIDNMNSALRKKNTEQFERFLLNQKIAHQVHKTSLFSLDVLDGDLAKSYHFVGHSATELQNLIQTFKKLTYLSGGIGDVEYKNLHASKSALWGSLFNIAKQQANERARMTKRQLGKLLESAEQTDEIEGVEMIASPSDESFGKLKMTVRFRFELL